MKLSKLFVLGALGLVSLGANAADLIERTGLDISKVEVGHIDYLRDVAFVKVYYKPIDGEVNTIDTITKLKDFDV